MPDLRSLIEKLEAMAAQTASPAEALVARAKLAELERSARGTESARGLTRRQILDAADETQWVQRPRTEVWDGVVYVWDEWVRAGGKGEGVDEA